jgi:hypothetical protein
MKYVANILFPNTTEYIHQEVIVDRQRFAPRLRACIRACRIAKKAAKLHHCYAYVSYKEVGFLDGMVMEYDFSEKYDQ